MSFNSQLPEQSPTSVPSPSKDDQQAEASPEPAAPETEAEPVDPQEAALAEMGAIKIYSRGDLVEGSVVQVTADSLIVDIGTKTEGIITRDEISIGPAADLSVFSVGDPVKAVVIQEDEEGTYHLSKRRADQILVWEKVEESTKEGTRIEATGFRAVKGGLLVDMGTIAFLPQSLCDIRRVDDLESMVGQKFEVKVVEYDRDAKPHPKIVVSRRACMEEDLTRERDKVYDSLKVGEVRDGRVVKLTNYGAFVDLGGVQGLLHISEMSLGRIRHPSEVMKEGETIKVKVLKIDKKRKRVSIGRRDLLPNPWDTIHEKYKQGMVVQGVVVRTADFGAFIKIDDYFEGLAHISELVDNKISHAREVFNSGDKVNVYIMNVDRKSKRIKLSVRRAADAQHKAEVDAFMKRQGDLDNIFASRLEEAVRESEIDLPEKPAVEKEVKAEAKAETEEKAAEEKEEVKAEAKVETEEKAAEEKEEVKAEAKAETEEKAAEEKEEVKAEAKAETEEKAAEEKEEVEAEAKAETEEKAAEEKKEVEAEAKVETEEKAAEEKEEVKAEAKVETEEKPAVAEKPKARTRKRKKVEPKEEKKAEVKKAAEIAADPAKEKKKAEAAEEKASEEPEKPTEATAEPPVEDKASEEPEKEAEAEPEAEKSSEKIEGESKILDPDQDGTPI